MQQYKRIVQFQRDPTGRSIDGIICLTDDGKLWRQLITGEWVEIPGPLASEEEQMRSLTCGEYLEKIRSETTPPEKPQELQGPTGVGKGSDPYVDEPAEPNVPPQPAFRSTRIGPKR